MRDAASPISVRHLLMDVTRDHRPVRCYIPSRGRSRLRRSDNATLKKRKIYRYFGSSLDVKKITVLKSGESKKRSILTTTTRRDPVYRVSMEDISGGNAERH